MVGVVLFFHLSSDGSAVDVSGEDELNILDVSVHHSSVISVVGVTVGVNPADDLHLLVESGISLELGVLSGVRGREVSVPVSKVHGTSDFATGGIGTAGLGALGLDLFPVDCSVLLLPLGIVLVFGKANS